jgi:cell division protein FtsL
MIRSKMIISTMIFLFLLVITSIIKNQTRTVEKNLYKLNKKISFKEKDINESQLDFHFLTSPTEIEEKIKILGQNNYSHIENSKIFLSLSDLMGMKDKISVFNNYDEKKAKKN